MSIKVGDRVFFNQNKQLGTVTHVYESDISGAKIADIKSCGQYYTSRISSLELVPADWKPRWRQS